MSSEEPNLQNIPAGEGYAGRIKAAFRPENPQWRFLVADYSQVELRILSILSADAALKKAFADGRDIHAETAKFLFPDAASISKDQRRIAKTVNFGVIYGITGFGLSKTIGTSPTEATRYIETFFARYSGVRAYYDQLLEKARQTGYVETFFGRRRYVKGLSDSNQTIQKSAEREAINMPVQGTAADVVKFAMVEIADRLAAAKMESRMIMQVHDELVFEGPENEMPALEKLVREVMEGVLKDPDVTLAVDIATGENWLAAKG
jgi:DNA polymerase-1